MKKFVTFLVITFFAILLVGCKKENLTGSIVIPSSENLQPVFDAGENTCSIAFSATADWTASVKSASTKKWISVSPSSGESGSWSLRITVEQNDGEMRNAVVELKCGDDVRKISVTQNRRRLDVCEGLPAVWDFYALGFDNSTKGEACEHPSAAQWKTSYAHPVLKTTHGNPSAYMQVYAKEGLFVKSDMTVTLNPGIQACGLLEGDYYEFVIPVKKFTPQTEISVYGATGGKNVSVAFWTLEYSADGTMWYQASGAQDVTVGSVRTSAHFWNTPATVGEHRTDYFASADDSFHFYRFCCSNIGNIMDGNLHLRLKAQKFSGLFDGSSAQKGWSDIKAFHVYFAEDKPNPLMKVVAHRGGYLENGFPECSRAALKKTLSQNCCGSECDIMCTADNELTVVHPDENGCINGLKPNLNTLENIRKAGSLKNGETIPSFKDYLDIIMDDNLNPYGAQIWVDVKWINEELSDKAFKLALEQAKEKKALDRIVLMIKDNDYIAKAFDIRNMYGVEVAWNGKIVSPDKYGPDGWAQLQYTEYSQSEYWPPTTYSDAGVQISIYNCSGKVSGYKNMCDKESPKYLLQYYPILKAIFVNHPMEIARHLVRTGYEK